MYRSLLVPLDGSASSERALPIAANIARRSGATLRLAYVHIPSGGIYIEGMQAADAGARLAQLEGAHAYLEGVRTRMASAFDIPIACDVLDGPVAGAIADHAVAADVDLVIIMTHGREGLARLWLGSVTDALVRWSKAPILALPHAGREFGVESVQGFQRILIPLDGSALSEQILEPVIALGILMQAECILVHVVEPFGFSGYAPLARSARLDVTATARQQSEAQDYLDQVAVYLQSHKVAVRTRVLIAREPARAILDDARKHGIDLIAMATHGRGGLARLIVGGLPVQVLHHGALPVLLYRPRERSVGADRGVHRQPRALAMDDPATAG